MKIIDLKLCHEALCFIVSDEERKKSFGKYIMRNMKKDNKVLQRWKKGNQDGPRHSLIGRVYNEIQRKEERKCQQEK